MRPERSGDPPEKGAIAPLRGPAKAMADFHAAGHGESRSGGRSVGIGCPRFIADDEDRLVRLRNAIFERLLRDPQHHTATTTVSSTRRRASLPRVAGGDHRTGWLSTLTTRTSGVRSQASTRAPDSYRLSGHPWASAIGQESAATGCRGVARLARKSQRGPFSQASVVTGSGALLERQR